MPSLRSRFHDWINVALYSRGWIEIRRIDVMCGSIFVVCVVYSYVTAGWLVAVQHALFMVMIAMIALWMI